MSTGSQSLIQHRQYRINIRLCLWLAADGLAMTSHWSCGRGCGHTGRRRTCYKDKEISLRTPWEITLRSTPHSPELRGGAVTPTGGGASGLWIGGVMGGVPVPKDQWTPRCLQNYTKSNKRISCVTWPLCWLCALNLELLSCSGGSSELDGPSEGHMRTEEGHSSLSPGYLGNKEINVFESIQIRYPMTSISNITCCLPG